MWAAERPMDRVPRSPPDATYYCRKIFEFQGRCQGRRPQFNAIRMEIYANEIAMQCNAPLLAAILEKKKWAAVFLLKDWSLSHSVPFSQIKKAAEKSG